MIIKIGDRFQNPRNGHIILIEDITIDGYCYYKGLNFQQRRFRVLDKELSRSVRSGRIVLLYATNLIYDDLLK